MAVAAIKQGPRLEFVLRKIVDKRKHTVHKYDEETKRLVPTEIEVDGGYVLYTCHGDIKVLSDKEVAARGLLNRMPDVINFDEIKDQKSMWGVYKYSPHANLRLKAWKEIEEDLIQKCTVNKGDVGLKTAPVTPKDMM